MSNDEREYERITMEPAERTGSQAKLPLNTMKIGECLFVPGMNIRQACSMVAYANKNRIGCIRKKYKCQTMERNGVKGVGIFRIKHPTFDSDEFKASYGGHYIGD